MKSDQRLDLAGVVIPFDLALCKSTLDQMAPGAILEIRLQDRDTLQDLVLIVERAGNGVLAWEKHEHHYHLWVQKSPEIREHHP